MADADLTQDMPINAVTKLTLHYPISQKENRQIKPLQLSKQPIPLDLVEPVIISDRFFRPEGAPPRVRVVLPESRYLQLDLLLTDILAEGRSGIVFGTQNQDDSANLPPLVVKIARKSFTKFIAREAWFYDELACLQGSVIPRCFGYFSVKLSEDSISVWDQLRPNPPEFVDDYPSDTEYSGTPPATLAEQTQMECGVFGLPLGKFNSELLGDVCEAGHFSLILMERLSGEKLPGNPYSPERQEHKEEVSDLFRCIGDLGIFHGDVKFDNIIKALPSPPGMPSLPCPVGRSAGKIFKWRAIDFELSQKNNKQTYLTDFYYNSAIREEFAL